MYHLRRTLQTIALHGSAVIVGRGAQFALNERQALRVRAVSPLEARVRTLITTTGSEDHAARAEIKRIDEEHAAFVNEEYARDLHDPSAYDLFVNTATFEVDGAATIVVAAYRRRFGESS